MPRPTVLLLAAVMLALSPHLAMGAGTGADTPDMPAESFCTPMLLLKVVDADTVAGYIDTSDPEVAVRASLRLEGIDAPETGGRARCVEERWKAREAKAFLTETLAEALDKPTRSLARVCAVKSDKYARRRLGRLEVKRGRRWLDVAGLMLEQGYALPYWGGRRGMRWCECLIDGRCP